MSCLFEIATFSQPCQFELSRLVLSWHVSCLRSIPPFPWMWLPPEEMFRVYWACCRQARTLTLGQWRYVNRVKIGINAVWSDCLSSESDDSNFLHQSNAWLPVFQEPPRANRPALADNQLAEDPYCWGPVWRQEGERRKAGGALSPSALWARRRCWRQGETPPVERGHKTQIQISRKSFNNLEWQGICASIPPTQVEGATALHLCVRYTALTAVHVLVSHGANVNAANSSGMTPLHMAAGTLCKDLIVSLVEEGADVNTVGWSSLVILQATHSWNWGNFSSPTLLMMLRKSLRH